MESQSNKVRERLQSMTRRFLELELAVLGSAALGDMHGY